MMFLAIQSRHRVGITHDSIFSYVVYYIHTGLGCLLIYHPELKTPL